ncbi:MAG: hypothetical protein U9Q81_23085 [Pseudomonadota bacterium]|nr:hypothetical protein [Pseudomonadota bacterium]
MTRLFSAIAATLFAGSVGAVDIYRGFQQGNPDLSGDRANPEAISGVQPGIGDEYDLYHGWAEDNPDLFRSQPHGYIETDNPEIYDAFGNNPDLQY